MDTARPIPREPPVTSATRPSCRNISETLRELGHVVRTLDPEDAERLVDALDEPLQDLARADLDDRPDPEGHEPLDAFAPPDRAVDLADEQPLDLGRIGDRVGRDVRDDRDPRRAHRDRLEGRGEALG